MPQKGRAYLIGSGSSNTITVAMTDDNVCVVADKTSDLATVKKLFEIGYRNHLADTDMEGTDLTYAYAMAFRDKHFF